MRMESSSAVALCLSASAVLLCLAYYISNRGKVRPLEGQGWRLRRVFAGRWSYEEKIGSQWAGIPFEEPQDFREPPYVVIAPSEDTWHTFPAWAQGRRAEIVGRVQLALSSSNFVVEVPGGAPASACAPGAPRA
jgi:hypothetical protein